MIYTDNCNFVAHIENSLYLNITKIVRLEDNKIISMQMGLILF